MAPTPTSRTIAVLKRQGYIPWNVESWPPHTGKRLDFYGIADTFFVYSHLYDRTHPRRALVVQSTTLANKAARVKKVLASRHTAYLLAAGIGVEVWAWGKRGRAWTPSIASFCFNEDHALAVVHHDLFGPELKE